MIYTDLTKVPTGHFAVIYADPAWSFRTYSKQNVVPQRAGKQHYVTMTADEMRAMDVERIAAKNCVLLMWITGANLEEGMALAKHWGFTYKAKAFTWCKITKRDDVGQFGFYPPEISPRMGLGKWTRQESEDCYLFSRGKPKRLSGGVRQLIFAPRRQHSRKPDETRDRIERLCGGPYIELFARTAAPGWDAWGNQTDMFQGAG